MKINNLNYKGILKDINLEFKPGEITYVLGKNGSGKSSLLKCISGLVEYEGEITSGTKALVFQNPENQFVRSIVKDDLAFSLEKDNLNIKEMDKKILEISNIFHVDHLLNKSVLELSGGEKQKIAIISNLLLEPKVLLLDECFEMIDKKSTLEILKILQHYVKQNDIICISVVHNMEMIEKNEDIIYLKNGKVAFDGPAKVFWENTTLLNTEVIDLPLYQRFGFDNITNFLESYENKPK